MDDHPLVSRPLTAALVAAALGLAGTLGVILVLHRAAAESVERVLEERLFAAGRSSALLLEGSANDAVMQQLRAVNALESAYVISKDLTVTADSEGGSPHPADLLRVDADRVQRALGGEATVARSYGVGEVTVLTGYFPLRSGAVLGLEAGDAFAQARTGPQRALWLGLVLAAVTAAALAVTAAIWSRAERQRRLALERAARLETISRMAAVAAHEIRNPLAVIRGTIDLIRARADGGLAPKLGEALDDVLGEVTRLRRLTDDLLDLSADKPLQPSRVELGALLEEVARATEAAHPGVIVSRLMGAALWTSGDPQRLRQVFANLLDNAAQAQGQGTLELTAEHSGGQVVIEVRDHGPGIPPDRRERIFEPFFTTKQHGTGLGLAVARRLVEQHGGSLRLLDTTAGTAFEVRLPLSDSAGA